MPHVETINALIDLAEAKAKENPRGVWPDIIKSFGYGDYELAIEFVEHDVYEASGGVACVTPDEHMLTVEDISTHFEAIEEECSARWDDVYKVEV